MTTPISTDAAPLLLKNAMSEGTLGSFLLYDSVGNDALPSYDTRIAAFLQSALPHFFYELRRERSMSYGELVGEAR